MKATFTLGEEFDELTVDDRRVRTTFDLVADSGGGKMVLNQSQVDAKGNKAIIARSIESEDTMHVVMTCKTAQSTAVFNKVVL